VSFIMNKSEVIIYNTDDGRASVILHAQDGNVWMNQKQIAELFDTSVPNISTHTSNILKEKELKSDSVIKDYLITADDGKIITLSSIPSCFMENKVKAIYDAFDQRRKKHEALEADALEEEEMKQIEEQIKTRKKDE